MADAWGRAKRALATKLCIRLPDRQRALEDAPPPPPPGREAHHPTTAVEAGPATGEEKARSPSVSSRRLSSSGSPGSKRVCAICLGSMRTGHGQALFTAECSHKFHFHCITSNVRHGNHICPICRADWKELPFQGPQLADATHGRARVSPVNWPQDDGHMAVIRRLSNSYSGNLLEQFPVFRTPEADIFNDDEQIDIQSETVEESNAVTGSVEIKTYAEVQAIQQSVTQKVFSILIHLKAPKSLESVSSRAPLDLVTVLDVSGSMKGAKLALLKKAMGFVIQTLGPNDRLSVIVFSSAARRLFPLRQMNVNGRMQAMQAVNSLVDGGGTNISDGLKKGAKVIEHRRLKNPVCSIILLSDGQDTYSVPTFDDGVQTNHSMLVPPSILPGTGNHVQIHTFGFGADHDSAAMHAIAETSSGTFSFIDAEGSIQNGFAQCIGGLLSVVVKEMRLGVECVDEGVVLTSIKSGGYASEVAVDGRNGSVDIGDLYADEERGFLITLHVPAAQGQQTVLIKPSCTYQDAVTTESIQVHGSEVSVERPAYSVDCKMSPEVEREWHRVQAMEDMSAARAAADGGDFSQAVSILEGRTRILESQAAQSSDSQCLALITELREMQERVESRRRYDESGRAFMLAGLSSHSWQRATARGDSTELNTQIHTYQTPSMVDMLHRSQTLVPAVVEMLNRSPTVAPSRGSGRSVRSTKSFSERLA
ncbi:E3 ubiquitin-protein ligase WAV3 [Aegilops tauschii subsp. strangulata]|uniref:VWFA domain-containing protein n=2 Tax=Aegilops tauschii subsp. strangulata TaxID=200361 RepID=A0A453J5H9_AEGTS|nr:E3 ubiquitin-protein ligase WAV3 [Aegilops tauschii subsp. strangulata]